MVFGDPPTFSLTPKQVALGFNSFIDPCNDVVGSDSLSEAESDNERHCDAQSRGECDHDEDDFVPGGESDPWIIGACRYMEDDTAVCEDDEDDEDQWLAEAFLAIGTGTETPKTRSCRAGTEWRDGGVDDDEFQKILDDHAARDAKERE